MASSSGSSAQAPCGVWTPANIVTCVRIVFIPVFMVLAELSCDVPGATYLVGPAVAACILYIVLSLTDKLDGYLARSRGEITDFGKFLDPIADKLLVFSALLILLEQGLVSVWVVFIILLREFLVSALRMVAGAQGVVIAADQLGKAKTAVTMVSLCGYFVAFAASSLGFAHAAAWLLLISGALMIAAVVLTVVSGVQYFWNGRSVIFS
ncbi:CDP-diacylglycerol--glycerol-3-phosphate 3-phosphatidyltransferase [Enorma burkinafasonensis]|uniref:CDP-diacylglycerol--glycerol-3-phosphate 3-phosphatidyltransferase n=1 Tax=Enorma burkinafasonensis TaxID=2590867 RepID=UPI0026EC744B|nr:CDP-diacylglycerol--glycerol-3-phosphate 3-phosphatidyltransferase [Enorma burkinafasonensis]MCI7731035.1 CDP-diacylglycerol--glycerol-3-phosphate 3-phosphatidyltransferase [Enorma burkinafasonensis]